MLRLTQQEPSSLLCDSHHTLLLSLINSATMAIDVAPTRVTYRANGCLLSAGGSRSSWNWRTISIQRHTDENIWKSLECALCFRWKKTVLSIQHEWIIIIKKGRRGFATLNALTNPGQRTETGRTDLSLFVTDLTGLTVCVRRVWIVVAQKAQHLLGANCWPQVSWLLSLFYFFERVKSSPKWWYGGS